MDCVSARTLTVTITGPVLTSRMTSGVAVPWASRGNSVRFDHPDFRLFVKIDQFFKININDCESNPCQGEESYCYDLVNSYECKCQAGLEGRSCEINIDECALAPCQHGTCQDAVGDYICHCKTGYSGRNCSQVRFIETGEVTLSLTFSLNAHWFGFLESIKLT